MRALGIDYGDARIGLAGCDDLGILAHPLETVAGGEWNAAIIRICEVAALRKVEVIALGIPLRMDGTEGTAAGKIRKFAAALRKALPESVTLDFIDETLSTTEAHAHLRAAGRKEKRHRKVIDQAAATIILQDFLDLKRGPQAFLIEDFDDDAPRGG